ncbi:hypothetical protein WN943_001363 [Citrus x changshan-huyou]
MLTKWDRCLSYEVMDDGQWDSAYLMKFVDLLRVMKFVESDETCHCTQDDENHQGNTIKASSDPLHIHGGSITRARAKKMQDIMNWAWRNDKALLALFKLLGSQIHNLDPIQKEQIRNKTKLDFEFSKRSYDQFITACSGEIPTTPLLIQLHLFVLFQLHSNSSVFKLIRTKKPEKMNAEMNTSQFDNSFSSAFENVERLKGINDKGISL